MVVWEWGENLAKTVPVLVIKFVGCAMDLVTATEMIDAATAMAGGGRIASTVMDKDQSNVTHVMENSSFWSTSNSL